MIIFQINKNGILQRLYEQMEKEEIIKAIKDRLKSWIKEEELIKKVKGHSEDLFIENAQLGGEHLQVFTIDGWDYYDVSTNN